MLDVGCGPGTITADIAELVNPGAVTAIDPEAEVLAEAAEAAAQRGVANIEFAVADVYQLAYPDDSFDVVHAHQVLQHLPDPVTALREMRRVCRPTGVVAVRDADYAAMTWFPEHAALDEWLAMYRAVARSTGGEPDAGRRLRGWAERAGFAQVRCSASVWCYATAEELAWWSDLWAERVTRSSLAGKAVAGGVASEADLARIETGWREWAAAEDAWFSVLHGEVLASP